MKHYYVTSQRLEKGEIRYSTDIFSSESFAYVARTIAEARLYMMSCVEITEEEATEIKNKGVK